LARDKNKDELQTHQRDLELRQEEQDYKADIDLSAEELQATDDNKNEDKINEKK